MINQSFLLHSKNKLDFILRRGKCCIKILCQEAVFDEKPWH